MAFLTNCDNKGCGKYMEPKLSLQDQKIYCGECNKEIKNISSFAKSQMKSLGQVIKATKSSYAVRCEKCQLELTPKLSDDNKSFVCTNCKNIYTNISKSFEKLLIEQLPNITEKK